MKLSASKLWKCFMKFAKILILIGRIQIRILFRGLDPVLLDSRIRDRLFTEVGFDSISSWISDQDRNLTRIRIPELKAWVSRRSVLMIITIIWFVDCFPFVPSDVYHDLGFMTGSQGCGSGYGYFGQIRLRLLWSDPDPVSVLTPWLKISLNSFFLLQY